MTRSQLTGGLAAIALLSLFVVPRLVSTSAPATPPSSTSTAQPTVPPVEAPAQPAEEPATLELVFVLDTTGSMGGLIEGAKETIWSVVNDFQSQKPSPKIKVGLVAYRDRGDAYVTQVQTLTDDLDGIYGALAALRANGGGDGPESVVKGLVDAVREQPWTPSGEGRVFRSVFLVGDAPDKAYADEPTAEAVIAEARQANIYVNAIQCGTQGSTGVEFERIAALGGGTFRAVAQDGNVQRVATPMDRDLDRLERELSGTALPWGTRDEKVAVQDKLSTSGSASMSTKASRLSVLAKGGSKKVVTSRGKGDLLDDLDAGKVDLSALSSDELPDRFASLKLEAVKEEVVQTRAERARIQAEIDTLVAQRDAWLAEDRAKRKDAEASYDEEVVKGTLDKLVSLGYIE